MSRRAVVVAAAPDAQPRRLQALARWLIAQAARTAPASLAERLEEEWLADLAERHGGLAGVRLALGCCWAARIILHEHVPAKALAPSSAAGDKTMSSAHVHDDTHLLPRRTSALLLIVCLHAVLICGFAAGFGRTLIEAPPAVTSAEVLAEPHHNPVPPPQLPPSLQGSGDVDIPTPHYPIYFPTDPSPTNPVGDASQGPVAPSSAARVRELGGPGKGFPDTNDYYPASSIRLGEMGVATVRVCVDVNGRLTSDPAIAHSAGSPRLDDGALRLARAGSGRYRATTEDGRPVDSCYPFRIRFQIRK